MTDLMRGKCFPTAINCQTIIKNYLLRVYWHPYTQSLYLCVWSILLGTPKMENSSHNLEDNCDSFSHEFCQFFSPVVFVKVFYFFFPQTSKTATRLALIIYVWMAECLPVPVESVLWATWSGITSSQRYFWNPLFFSIASIGVPTRRTV